MSVKWCSDGTSQRSCWGRNPCENNGPNQLLCHHTSGSTWATTKPEADTGKLRCDVETSPVKKPKALLSADAYQQCTEEAA